jgi:carboxyl-terminal processing protease
MVAPATKPLAHIVIPFFYSQDRTAVNDYATKVQDSIAVLALKKPCGWIVDLRGNGGGNMWAMLAGIGPILGEGEPGASLGKDGIKRKWFYETAELALGAMTRTPTTLQPLACRYCWRNHHLSRS